MSTGLIIFLCIVGLVAAAVIQNKMVQTQKDMVCTNCGFKGQPITHTKGSIFIEIILWFCLLVPGIIYSIWRLTSKEKVCPVCKAPHMIPEDSPMAKKFQ